MRIAALLLLSLACEAQVLVKQGNDPKIGNYVVMQVAAQQPYPKADGQTFTPEIGVRCSQIGDQRRTEFFILTGGIDSSMIHGGSVDIPLQVDSGNPVDSANLIARRFTLRSEDDTLFAEFRPPLPWLDGKAIYLEFLPTNSVTKVISRFDISGLGAEFNKHSECVPPAQSKATDAKNSGQSKEDAKFPLAFTVLSATMTTDCYMSLQNGGRQFFVKGLGLIHCTTFYPGQELRGTIGTGLHAGYLDLRWSDGGKYRTAHYRILRTDLLPR